MSESSDTVSGPNEEAAGGRRSEWHAFVVTTARPAAPADCGWTAADIPAGRRIELRTLARQDWRSLAMSLLLPAGETARAWMLTDGGDSEGHFRAVAFEDDLMAGALLAGPAPLGEGREWLVARLGTALGPTERFRLLAGRPGGYMRARGATVCFCCDIGHNEIADAVAAGSTSIRAIGEATRAGTNCGRCRDDLACIIAEAGAMPGA